ncbi:MAG: lamin tail domain-containing protein [Candidatus Aenigmarchaeota archaeon]|nr:lamin tail domain-containing protein [Candidatus Aenigmarchaeota archaeon]
MNLSDIAIVASIIAGLTSVPFVASTISTDYNPIGTTVLNMSSVDDIPGELSRSLTSDKFEQTYNTPFGKFTIIVEPHRIYQELIRPDRRVTVEQTPEKTEWKLSTQEYILVVSKTGKKIVDRFTSPDGYLEKTKEMGNISESTRGDVEDEYTDAKEMLQEELGRMEKIKQEYMEIPGTGKAVRIAINEILPNPVGNDTTEFIELYNYGSSDVDVTGWSIGDGSTSYTLSGALVSKNFLVLWRNETGIALNNNGDDIKLYDGNNNLVDEFSYSSSTEGKSWARVPDGTGSFEERNPTPGSAN